MKKLILSIFSAALPASIAWADMGSIPFKRGSRITEPKQDAIIAWNGQEEILYLQTTLAASEPTKVLEVMPLPNKPTVTAAEPGIFKRCAYLLPRPPLPASYADPFSGETTRPAAEVVERKQIGAHDLRVVKLISPQEFSDWIRNEFAGELTVPDELLEVIREYAADGFGWFLFDTVDLEREAAKKTPLQIRFASDHLYFPLRITRTEKGYTKVSLTILTTVLFTAEDCVGIPREAIDVAAAPATIFAHQVQWIDPPVFELLGRPRSAKLRSWTISGPIDSFEHDLLVRHPARKGNADHDASRPRSRPR